MSCINTSNIDFGVNENINMSHEIVNGMYRVQYSIDVNDIMERMQYNYALLIFIISAVFLIYVLWNNFVRSPSNKKSLKDVVYDGVDGEKLVKGVYDSDIGVEPSDRVKKISRTLDEYMIVPALVLMVISLSYLLSF